MPRPKKPAATGHPPTDRDKVRLYTLEVVLLSGPVTEEFTRKNPLVARTIQMRGDQTLADLHHVRFGAFERWEEHRYEFQFGEGLPDPQAARFVLPGASRAGSGGRGRPAGRVDKTTLDSLRLEVGRRFSYWFDLDADWWHQISVQAVEDGVSGGQYPRVLQQVGSNPPQYAREGRDQEGEASSAGISWVAAADAACLVGELHLRKGQYEKAVQAFTRAIENSPTRDAYQGRAKAYRALADRDEREARGQSTGG